MTLRRILELDEQLELLEDRDTPLTKVESEQYHALKAEMTAAQKEYYAQRTLKPSPFSMITMIAEKREMKFAAHPMRHSTLKTSFPFFF